MEEKEKRKIKEVITLAKENLILNEKQFEKMCSITDDEYLLYTLSRDYETKKRNLKRAISNPYFARVDFKAYTEEKWLLRDYLLDFKI